MSFVLAKNIVLRTYVVIVVCISLLLNGCDLVSIGPPQPKNSTVFEEENPNTQENAQVELTSFQEKDIEIIRNLKTQDTAANHDLPSGVINAQGMETLVLEEGSEITVSLKDIFQSKAASEILVEFDKKPSSDENFTTDSVNAVLLKNHAKNAVDLLVEAIKPGESRIPIKATLRFSSKGISCEAYVDVIVYEKGKPKNPDEMMMSTGKFPAAQEFTVGIEKKIPLSIDGIFSVKGDLVEYIDTMTPPDGPVKVNKLDATAWELVYDGKGEAGKTYTLTVQGKVKNRPEMSAEVAMTINLIPPPKEVFLYDALLDYANQRIATDYQFVDKDFKPPKNFDSMKDQYTKLEKAVDDWTAKVKEIIDQRPASTVTGQQVIEALKARKDQCGKTDQEKIEGAIKAIEDYEKLKTKFDTQLDDVAAGKTKIHISVNRYRDCLKIVTEYEKQKAEGKKVLESEALATVNSLYAENGKFGLWAKSVIDLVPPNTNDSIIKGILGSYEPYAYSWKNTRALLMKHEFHKNKGTWGNDVVKQVQTYINEQDKENDHNGNSISDMDKAMIVVGKLFFGGPALVYGVLSMIWRWDTEELKRVWKWLFGGGGAGTGEDGGGGGGGEKNGEPQNDDPPKPQNGGNTPPPKEPTPEPRDKHTRVSPNSPNEKGEWRYFIINYADENGNYKGYEIWHKDNVSKSVILYLPESNASDSSNASDFRIGLLCQELEKLVLDSISPVVEKQCQLPIIITLKQVGNADFSSIYRLFDEKGAPVKEVKIRWDDDPKKPTVQTPSDGKGMKLNAGASGLELVPLTPMEIAPGKYGFRMYYNQDKVEIVIVQKKVNEDGYHHVTTLTSIDPVLKKSASDPGAYDLDDANGDVITLSVATSDNSAQATFEWTKQPPEPDGTYTYKQTGKR